MVSTSSSGPSLTSVFHQEWKTQPSLSRWGIGTPLGDVRQTLRALHEGKRALAPHTLPHQEEDTPLQLALWGGDIREDPPRWETMIRALQSQLPEGSWGGYRHPVLVSSSNFGIDQLLAFTRDQNIRRLEISLPHTSVDRLAGILGWTTHPTLISQACVSSSLALTQACNLIENNLADEVLVFSFDLISAFVASGFASLKILHTGSPAPFSEQDVGAIGLGDGVAWVVVSRDPSPHRITHSFSVNEMYHMTANQPEGLGFHQLNRKIQQVVGGEPLWIKGHGTGTLDAGRMEAESSLEYFPHAPLVSWKGSLGHTLGTCGLLETNLALQAIQEGSIPGTVGASLPTFGPMVALSSFPSTPYSLFLSNSNAFGGSHVSHLITQS